MNWLTHIEPEIWVEDAAEAVTFYERALGAEVLHRVGDGNDIVARLAVGEGRFWVAPANPGSGRHDAARLVGATGRLLLVVDDPSETFARALAARCARAGLGTRGTRLDRRPSARPLRPRVGDRPTTGEGIGRTADRRGVQRAPRGNRSSGLAVRPPSEPSGLQALNAPAGFRTCDRRIRSSAGTCPTGET